jgi:hypothetical protein
MRMAALAIVSLALSVGAASGTPGPPQPPRPVNLPTGASGYVSRGAITADCGPGTACFRAAHVILRFTRVGAVPIRTATRTAGAYRVALRPGTYAVSVVGSTRRLKPPTLRVPTDHWVRVDFVLSTAIS